MATPRAAKLKLLKWADKQIGTVEKPPNSNQIKYATWARIPGQPYCAGFVSMGLAEVGVGMADDDPYDEWFFVYTPTGYNIFKAAGRAFTDISKAKPADVVFFANYDRICHTGYVEKNLGGGRLQTIEANTSSGSAGSQRDGGGVFRRTRVSVPGFTIAGFGRPPYADAEGVEPVYTFPKRDWIGKGDKGDDVRLLQQDLNAYFRLTGRSGDIKLDADGEFGKATSKALKQFQHERDLDVDGRAGDHTIDKLEVVIKRRRKARRDKKKKK